MRRGRRGAGVCPGPGSGIEGCGEGVGLPPPCFVGPGVGSIQGVGSGEPSGPNVASGSKDVPGSHVGGGAGVQMTVGANTPPQLLPNGAKPLL